MNHLAAETSPYLRQHAENPVDWYPWGSEAFAEAARRDVPVLLSVGYSACHWCHVMAHESFEDPATAEIMNRGFVNVKVDREERPDVDSIYMAAVQAVTGGGGWPMTVFLLPDGRPFLGGTYFPRPRFVELLGQIQDAWRERRADIDDAAQHLANLVRAGTDLPTASARPVVDIADHPGRAAGWVGAASRALLERFDPEWGGFGRAPKFPQPATLELLLQAHVTGRTGRPPRPASEAGAGSAGDGGGWREGGPAPAGLLGAVVTTLDAMASGGIYDHLGGGFARYATDRRWLVPHFEKMLYDNALLARLYLHAWQVTGHERYRQVVRETLGYLLRPPVRQASGGFSSAEDADSEGVEGRFYVWSAAEVAEVGGPAAASWYGVSDAGNWEGHNILWRPERGDLLRPPEVEAARQALFRRRETRVRPGLDDKVLTEWNAMAVAVLAEAGAVLAEPGWVAAATEVAELLLRELRRADGRWLRSWQAPTDGVAGRAQHLAYAADHAWLVEAFTQLAEATGQARWIGEAREAADALLGHFWDGAGGGFHTTSDDGEALIARPKDTYDGALPSANSVATAALVRLSALTGDTHYRSRAADVVDAMAPALAEAPLAFSALVAAADVAERGLTEIVVTGQRPDLVQEVRRHHLPASVLAWGEPFDSPLWEGRQGSGEAGLAFVCRDYACRAPVGEPEALAALLDA